MNGVDAARQLLAAYGAQVRASRKECRWTLQDVTELVIGMHVPHLSEIENGLRCPSPEQASSLSIVLGMPDHVPTAVPHARQTDPVSSDITVKSIANDKPLRDRIAHIAEAKLGAPFDDTDLAALLGGQRNVVARARGRLEAEPDSPIIRIGQLARTRNGQTRSTVHYTTRNT